MQNFKQRWNINSNAQVAVILIVFAITGSSSMIASNYLLDFFQITLQEQQVFVFYLTKIAVVTFVYQILLVTFGFLFGQFDFFWRFEKKMLCSLGLGFLFK